MTFNIHLLQKELTVEEYEKVVPSIQYNPQWQCLPAYMIARCPYCSAKNIERLDTYTLRRWRILATISTVSNAIFNHNLVTHHCSHFVLTQIFFNFHGDLPAEVRGQGIARNEPPYIIGHLLESNRCLAVIHALPICRIERGKFMPGYSLFIFSYFSKQPREAIQDVYKYNDKWYSLEASGTLYLPLQFGEPYWADLPRWVAAGQLYWVDGNDPDLNIHTHDVNAFPYGNIAS